MVACNSFLTEDEHFPSPGLHLTAHVGPASRPHDQSRLLVPEITLSPAALHLEKRQANESLMTPGSRVILTDGSVDPAC